MTGQAEKLPPLSYTCPMHPEILEDKGGICPICKMDLVPIRLDSVWTCGTKPLAVVKDGPGRCPIDGSAAGAGDRRGVVDLPGGTEESASPGMCAGGSPKTKTYALRAHGNHNPQHGGLFFMASRQHPSPRGRVSPDWRVPDVLLRRIHQAAVARRDEELQGDADGEGPEHRPRDTGTRWSARPRYFQAQVGKLPLPADMYALVKFAASGKDNRFDFTFPTYSKEPHAAASPTLTKRRTGGASAPVTEAPPMASTASLPASIPRWCRCRFRIPCPKC